MQLVTSENQDGKLYTDLGYLIAIACNTISVLDLDITSIFKSFIFAYHNVFPEFNLSI